MTATPITELLDAARLGGLITTPNGRIVAKVSRLDAKGSAYRSELAELEGDSFTTLTRGNASVGAVALAEDGTTFFTAKRVGEDGEQADDAQLWALPTRGESRQLATRPGGFCMLHLGDGRLIAELSVHSQANSEKEHAELSKQRKDAKVSASFTAEFPTRYWDQDLGPSRRATTSGTTSTPSRRRRATRTAARATATCTSPTRATGSLAEATRRSGTSRSSRSSTSTCTARPGSAPRRWDSSRLPSTFLRKFLT